MSFFVFVHVLLKMLSISLSCRIKTMNISLYDALLLSSIQNFFSLLFSFIHGQHFLIFISYIFCWKNFILFHNNFSVDCEKRVHFCILCLHLSVRCRDSELVIVYENKVYVILFTHSFSTSKFLFFSRQFFSPFSIVVVVAVFANIIYETRGCSM